MRSVLRAVSERAVRCFTAMKTRVFFDGRRSRDEPIVMLRLEDRTVHVERGVGMQMRKAKSTSRTHATAAAARKAFVAECKKLEKRSWWEIRVALEPRFGDVLAPRVHRALLLSAVTELETEAPSTNVKPAAQDRSRVLRDLVTSGKRVRAQGELLLPTGKLVAYDPMLIASADVSLPFETPLRPGAYPVVLSIRDRLVVAASVVVEDAAPETWELALPRGMKKLVPAKYRVPSEHPGYTFPVDSATSCFVDASALDAFEDDRFVTRLLAERAMNRCHPLPKSNATVAVFRSANRDGSYATYFGMRGKKIVCVTTDFGA